LTPLGRFPSNPAMRSITAVLVLAAAASLHLSACGDRVGLESGFAHDPNYRQEFFMQLEPSEADILWVIDSSCSMTDEQAALVENFPNFIEFFLTRRLAFRLAVTTTNIDDPNSEGLDGRFNGDPPWITEQTEDLEASFLERALVGIDPGHGKEKGLEAAYRALEDPDERDAGFLRQDAQLAVVIVSDEPDHSERLDEPDHDQYIDWRGFSDWLDELKGPQMERMSQVSAIVGVGEGGFEDPNGCGGDWEQDGEGALRGDGYLEAADATGGTWVSICEEDWGDMMARVGLAAAGLMDAWVLEEEPLPNSLRVSIDGHGTADWEYRAWDNAIHFTRAEAIPRPGSRVEVTYSVPGAD
jgi:hypothetical protein